MNNFSQKNKLNMENLLKLLIEKSYKKGNFTLASDKQSDHYLNCKPVSLNGTGLQLISNCLLYTSPSPRDATLSRMPSSA